MYYLLAALIFLSGCSTTTNPGPDYSLKNKDSGVFASKMNSIENLHYCKFIFENKDSGKKMEHIVHRAGMDDRGALIVSEMGKGRWELVRFDIFEGYGERRQFYRIDDDLRIGFEIREGEVNVFPFINIDYDCHMPSIRLAGMKSKCFTYTFELSGKESEIENEVRDNYSNLAGLKFNSAIKDRDISSGYSKSGKFR